MTNVNAADGKADTMADPLDEIDQTHGVVFFDGVCNFCEASVLFVIDRDRNDYFRFAPLQSSAAERILGRLGCWPITDDSIHLVEKGMVYRKSSAALRVAGRLVFPWPMLGVCWVVPWFCRDLVYGWIAKNRYRWFGKKDACRLPSAELRAKFLQ